MNISDEQLRQYVDNVFNKYDKNGSLTLDQKELYYFFKDLFTSMNFKHDITVEDVKYSIKQIDTNKDGKITKRQLFNALKVILGTNKQKQRKEPNLPFQQPKIQIQQSPINQKRINNQYRKKAVSPRISPPHQNYNRQNHRQYSPNNQIYKQIRQQPSFNTSVPNQMMNLMRNIGMGAIQNSNSFAGIPAVGRIPGKMVPYPFGFW